MFNAHYDEYGFQPIVVFDGDGRFVTAVLRPAKRPGGVEIARFLRRLLRPIPANWPATQILIRADSHFCCPEMIDFCRANGLDFILGVASSASLRASRRARREPIRGSSSPILRAAKAKALYQDIYCRRGCAENHIKSWKTHLAADRTSCSKAAANQFRLFLHAGAYWLLWALRAAMPKRSLWRVAQFDTLRLRLVIIAVRVIEMKTQIRLHLPTACHIRRSCEPSSGACRVPLPDRRAPMPPTTPVLSTPKTRHVIPCSQSGGRQLAHSSEITGTLRGSQPKP